MTELLSILYKLRIFTLDELSEALKDKVKAVEALLARYKQQGFSVPEDRLSVGAHQGTSQNPRISLGVVPSQGNLYSWWKENRD